MTGVNPRGLCQVCGRNVGTSVYGKASSHYRPNEGWPYCRGGGLPVLPLDHTQDFLPYAPISDEEAVYLAQYDPSKFPVTMVTVDLVIYHQTYVLLVKRGGFPYKDYWALPGGFVDQNETLAQAALRELKEETGVTLYENQIRPVCVLDKPDRDPRGRAISHVFVAIMPYGDLTAKAGDDASEAKWWDLNHVKHQMNLAFDHKLAIMKALVGANA